MRILGPIHDLITQLNSAVESAAINAGFEYVDPEPKFVGHEACPTSGDPYFWGLALTDYISGEMSYVNPSNMSFHPNHLGQQVVAEAVEEEISTKPVHITGTYLPAANTPPCDPTVGLCAGSDLLVIDQDGKVVAHVGFISVVKGHLFVYNGDFSVWVPDLPVYQFAIPGTSAFIYKRAGRAGPMVL